MSEITGAWRLFNIGNMLMNFGVAILAMGLLLMQGTSITTSNREKKLKILLGASSSITITGVILQIYVLLF